MDQFFSTIGFLLVIFFVFGNGLGYLERLYKYWVDRKYPQPVIMVKSLEKYIDPDGKVIITKEELNVVLSKLNKFERRSAVLDALEAAGVDSWEGYDDAILDYEHSVLSGGT